MPSATLAAFSQPSGAPAAPVSLGGIDRLRGWSDSCANSSSEILYCTTELGAGLGTRLAERVESVSLIESA